MNPLSPRLAGRPLTTPHPGLLQTPHEAPSVFRWFRRNPQRGTIARLYGAIVAQARAPAFYADYGVADTVTGRFELIVLHLALVTARLRREPEPIRMLAQGVFDLFCQDMDHNFREMGIGDLAVPKHMQRVGAAFYGRAAAYDGALADAGDEKLAACLARNVFSDSAQMQPAGDRLARYARAACADLDRQEGEEFGRGNVTFPDPIAISVQ